MKDVGRDLHKATNAFAIPPCPGQQPRILDMCMAPGGFLATALMRNRGATAKAFSLPICDGGHEVLLPPGAAVDAKFLDITLLAADMGFDVHQHPHPHPDPHRFLGRHFQPDELFDLALCDGQVRRRHRGLRRGEREAKRLAAAQLALGLAHLRPGGTAVVLLHKLESWDAASVLWRFRRFAAVAAHKPTAAHTKRSSFYMVATNVRSRDPEALEAIEHWKRMWELATFGKGEEEGGEGEGQGQGERDGYDDEFWRFVAEDKMRVQEMLEEMGPLLEDWGRSIWKTQAVSLARSLKNGWR